MALRAKLMLHEKNSRFDSANNSRTVTEENKDVVEKPGGDNEKKSEKANGKRPFKPKGVQKQDNPYAKPILGKCYRCN